MNAVFTSFSSLPLLAPTPIMSPTPSQISDLFYNYTTTPSKQNNTPNLLSPASVVLMRQPVGIGKFIR